MKKKTLILAATMFGLFFLSSNATAAYLDPNDGWKNITGYDGLKSNKNNDPWRNTENEDQEVEPGAATGQQWDLEGFFLNEDTQQLALVGGFDFINGQSDILSGDIFIDTDMDPSYYEYVMDLNFENENDLKYDVYENKNENNDAQEITYNLTSGGPSGDTQNQPYSRLNGGKSILSDLAITYLYNKSDSEIAGGTLQGDHHNAVIVDVSFLGSDISKVTYHNQIGCANDGLQGGGSAAVPEPATIFLLGSGLLGLFGYRKKIRKTNK